MVISDELIDRAISLGQQYDAEVCYCFDLEQGLHRVILKRKEMVTVVKVDTLDLMAMRDFDEYFLYRIKEACELLKAATESQKLPAS